MELDSLTSKKLYSNYSLICNIIQDSKKRLNFKVDLKKLEKIINVKIPETLKNNAPDDFYDLYVDFKAEYERFKDFILYNQLIGKNIVALGGGFSSGKSSFLNALMGKNILPSDIDPTTSVPTYIVAGDKHHVCGTNIFDQTIEMQPKDIRKIAHGFGELENENADNVSEEVTLGHLLENIFFSTPLHKFKNIAFLDTPGYSKPDSEKYSSKTDEQIARGQLNSSNYILWFVQADAGTITEEDIRFINTLRTDIPKLIIVNKADKKSFLDLNAIVQQIKSSLNLRSIQYIDVLTFSSRIEQIAVPSLKNMIVEDIEKIKGQLQMWNTQVYEANFAVNFKVLFDKCREYYFNKITEENRKLSKLNTSIMLLNSEYVKDTIMEPLQILKKEIKDKILELQAINDKLKIIQDEFFTEIKYIGDMVGIQMPESSEVNLIKNKTKSPLDVINELKSEKSIISNNRNINVLKDIFGSGISVENNKTVGTEYQNVLIAAIKKVCDVNPNDINNNESLKNKNEYRKLMKR